MKKVFGEKLSPSSPRLSSAANFLAPPRNLFSDSSSTVGSDKGSGKSRSRSSSFGRIFSNSSDNEKESKVSASLPKEQTVNTLSPELVPIVTLLSAQSHRRYHEGVFLILKDLKSDGSPADRVWKEVFGVLIGTQLALWDATELGKNENDTEKLMEATLKPTYINFTDAQLKQLNSSDANLQGPNASRKNVENTIVVSTTLKNRYFLQFSDTSSFQRWVSAFRLSAFEFTLLQEAYTGAFLSTRGAKLSDIRVILADTKFDYEDWVSVRFGAGMPWKRCYAVISQPTKKNKEGKKKHTGEINFYENEKKTKKVKAMATITDAHAVYAIYPQSPVLIDTSTMIKLEGRISFGKKDTPKDTDIFVMPEKHYAVPGYDTIIRFLIPTMNAFNLYGRPKRLIANKDDPSSLLFALPTLPYVHYLEVEDLLTLSKQPSSTQWDIQDWRSQIKLILSKKQSNGYTGCGSSTGLLGALSSPAIGSLELFDHAPNSPKFSAVPRFAGTPDNTKFEPLGASPLRFNTSKETNLSPPKVSINDSTTPMINNDSSEESMSNSLSALNNSRSFSIPLTQNPTFENFNHTRAAETKGSKRVVSSIDIQDSNYDSFIQPRPMASASKQNLSAGPNNGSRLSDLSQIYDNYGSNHNMPLSQVENDYDGPFDSRANSSTIKDASKAYDEYTGSPKVKKFDISNIKSTGSDDVLEDFYQLSKQISSLSVVDNPPAATEKDDRFDFSNVNVSYSASSDNVFDPDYMEDNDMLDMESKYTKDDFKTVSTDSVNHQKFYEASGEVPNRSAQNKEYNSNPYINGNSYHSPEKEYKDIPRSNPVMLQKHLNPQQGPPYHGPINSNTTPRNQNVYQQTPQHSKVPPAGYMSGNPGTSTPQRIPPNGAGYERAPNVPQQPLAKGYQQRPLHPQQVPPQQYRQQVQGKPLPPQNPYGNVGRPAPKQFPHSPSQQFPHSPNQQFPPGQQYQQHHPQQYIPQQYPQKYPAPQENSRQVLNPQFNAPKSPANGGFSQFMPPSQSNNNPYSR
ncbi:unnamed protein product [Kluyveromyces dobzhanskii CBS 2104]|uniref:WGS project CCBQ000000000 data, contig MAT n=1 Tax=Kluyveromyces dobzhanskii CBS 2104 TaxID=1427455 RepID=A0A0A8L3F5_9SACH|nr:unnamed protein product [Kluyveromyces dobzhanskii CBS 2104]